MNSRKVMSPSVDLQATVEEMISGSSLSDITPTELDKLQSWLELEAYDDVMRVWDEQIAIKINDLAEFFFDDENAFDYIDVETPEDLTDELRLAYAIDRVRDCLDDDGFALTVHAYPVESSSGAKSFLGFTLETEGQGGPAFVWVGAFRSIEDFHAELERRNHWLIKDDFDDRLEGLLAKWQR